LLRESIVAIKTRPAAKLGVHTSCRTPKSEPDEGGMRELLTDAAIDETGCFIRV
jgi:hypothetical protein